MKKINTMGLKLEPELLQRTNSTLNAATLMLQQNGLEPYDASESMLLFSAAWQARINGAGAVAERLRALAEYFERKKGQSH